MIIKDVTKKIGSGATPTGGAKAYTHNGISLIRSQNVQDMSFDYEGLAHINEEQAAKLNNVEVERDDVLLNITGDSIARCCIVPDDVLPARVNQHVAIIRTKKVSSKYLLYFLQFLKPHLLQICNVGGTRNALTKEAIEKLPFWEISNSNNVAKLLDSLDSKIRNNNAINSELESMAKTLYDYWFLQFEFPNEVGNPYKSSGGRMVWNEELKREIPEGWKVENLMDNSLCVDIKAGVDRFESKNYLPTANINGDEITDGDYVTYDNRENRANMQPVEYSVWFAKMKNSIKHLSIPKNSDWFINKYILSTGFQGLRCSKESFSFIHCVVNSGWFETYKDILSHGATQEGVNNEDLKNIKFAVPTDKIIKQFSNIVLPVLEKKFSIIKENQELTSLRDFLLPLLMNGQVSFR